MPTFYVVQKRSWLDKATGNVRGRSFQAKDREAALEKVQRLSDKTGKEYDMVSRKNPSATTSKTELQTQVDTQQELIDQIATLVDDSLDPVLTREQLVEKLQQMSDLLQDDEDEQSEERDD